MPSVEIQIETERVEQLLVTVSNGLEMVTSAIIHDQLVAAQQEMQVEGDPIEYPVQWDSERQRRAYFATNGFGHGIPYHRTGAYVNAWQMEQRVYAGGSETRLYNDAPPAIYITGSVLGERQSRIHRGRWEMFVRIVQKYREQITTAFVDAVNKVLANGGNP